MNSKYRYVFLAVMILVVFVAQSTLMNAVSFGGISPNLLIFMTASFGFREGKKVGIVSGFVMGLLCDIFFGEIIGLYALIFMYIGYFNGFFKRLFFKDELLLQIGLVAGSDLIYNLCVYILTFLLRRRFHFGYYMLHVIIPEMVYTIILTILLFLLGNYFGRVIDAIKSGRSDSVIV